ncbi:uncharacterized protein LOC135491209 [Lineus longissimus]|uniref:uncharacterized protein LOC135491209 n=1 Tax=Lineus longissimus TaxID=88925 RepID=UPI00315DC5CD
MGKCWIAFVLFLFIAHSAGFPGAAKSSSRRGERFIPTTDEEHKAKIDEVIKSLKEKFGEVDPGFFDKLKETIISIPGTIKDKFDSLISGIFGLFGKGKSDKHEISAEEKAFRLKFNTILEEMKTKVPVIEAKRFMPSTDEAIKAQLDAVIAELKEKFGEVDPGFFDKLKETITSIPGKVKDKFDSIISSIFNLFGGNKPEEHEISPEEKAFRQKFDKILEEMMKKVPVVEE